MKLAPEVIEMIAHYESLRGERQWDWGDDRIEMFRWARFALLGDVFSAFAETGDWQSAVRAVVASPPPPGIAVVGIEENGELRAEVGRRRPGIVGGALPIDVVIDSSLDRGVRVTVDGDALTVPAGGTAVATLDARVEAPITLEFDGRVIGLNAIDAVAAARLRLVSSSCSRWSVTDDAGGAWFPDGVLRKWDVHHRPFFHAADVTFEVPCVPLRVSCTRGLEFDRVEETVYPDGEGATLRCEPGRLFDPAARGWYGADLHVHMNYSGDLVCTPADAARMQCGEGLHLANFVAGNCQTSLIYDRELLDAYAGVDLPWSTDRALARAGVEYRNDLLGHVHGLGPSRPPVRYSSGHERSDHPYDWPPNAAACEELRTLGATVGYPHPAASAFPADWSMDGFFAEPRSVEARELVADAALGLVDSIDVISPFNDDGAAFLYHRLLSCGIRLAATAGTDAFLSFSHGPGVASNPPGWARVYAHLGDDPLSVPAFQDAIRAGRTVVTNGPWLTFHVDGQGPGTVIAAKPGQQLAIQATTEGPGVEQLDIIGADGIIASGHRDVSVDLEVQRPTWLAAIARGPQHPRTLDAAVFAHTSAVYVDIDGRRVGRHRDAQWCLDVLNKLEAFVAEHGHFAPEARDQQLGDLAAVLHGAGDYYQHIVRSSRGDPLVTG